MGQSDSGWRLEISPPGPSHGHQESPARRAQCWRLANASDHRATLPPRHRCSARRGPGWCHGGAGARDRAGHRAAQPRCATSPTRPDIGADDVAGVRVQNKQRASKGDHAHRSINLSSPSNRSKSRSKLTNRQLWGSPGPPDRHRCKGGAARLGQSAVTPMRQAIRTAWRC